MSVAKSIMIQGTMSNAGKSLIAAGLCRIFKQDGYKVAPFKSQNMALNSYITNEGLEMGRAQVMQAEASGVEPSVLMNPILLKPTNDIGSQVIVNGEVRGNMSASDYYKIKKDLIPDIMKAYHTLESENDIIVIEGAGSPAEINLKENDIVNMGMAKLAKSPVLLVGDIDRGGVFAQLLGTIDWLENDEKNLLKGMLINKFRGDISLLKPGLSMIEERAGYPVLGVVPYTSVDIDDEDSLSERFNNRKTGGAVDIAVIKLPRISNFTDFNVFESFNEVTLRYVDRPQDLDDPDMIILPGTKNTIEDLMWLRQSGLEALILKQAAAGKIIFGICGGYQMLGEEILDPLGMEHKGSINGMGLLPMTTEFMDNKSRIRARGEFLKVEGRLSKLSGVKVDGYEIHMGKSSVTDDSAMSLITKNATKTNKDGSFKGELTDGIQKGNVYGTYLHGVFDAADVAKIIVESILEEKGIDSDDIKQFDLKSYKDRQYDILADAIRNSVDMDKIYKIIEQGV